MRRKAKQNKRKMEDENKKRSKKILVDRLGTLEVRIAEARTREAGEEIIEDLERRKKEVESRIKEEGFEIVEIESNIPRKMKKRIDRAERAKKRKEEVEK